MVKTITAKEKHNCEHLLGLFLDECHYDILIEEDCDFYVPNDSLVEGNGEHNIAFKFRKNVFSPEEQEGAYEGLIRGATETQNRGMAAGPKTVSCGGRDWVTDWQMEVLDSMINMNTTLSGSDRIRDLLNEKGKNRTEVSRGFVWLRNKIKSRLEDGEVYEGFFDTWLNKVIKLPVEERSIAAKEMSECISSTHYATVVNSGIVGYFDRYTRYPFGRVCSYNEKYPELFEKAYPYFRKLNEKFKELLPQRWVYQKSYADNIDKRYLIAGDTVFTTATINKTFRTAAHLDAGDLGGGFSNLGVITKGSDYKGGYLVLPEYRVAINVRPGDLLLIANHTAMHGNTEILPPSEDCCPECIERMSIVAYFRENMKLLGSVEYENERRAFIDHRRLNKEHPEWRELWNGVSSGMWDSQEWYDYLEGKFDNDGVSMLDKYHPSHSDSKLNSLEEFFG